MAMMPLSPYRAHHRHGATRGRRGHFVSQSRQQQLGQGQPGVRARCAPGQARLRDQGTRPTADPLCSSPGATRTKCHQWGGLQLKCIVSLCTCQAMHCLWRLKLPRHWQGREPSDTWGRTLLRLFQACGGLLPLLGAPWLVDASLQSSVFTQCSPCVCHHTDASYMGTRHMGPGARPTPAGPHRN